MNLKRANLITFLGIALFTVLTTSCVTAPGRFDSGSRDDSSALSDETIQQYAKTDQLRALKNKGPRKRVLVLPFLNESAEKTQTVTKTARDTFVRGLRYTDNFVVINNADLPKDLNLFVKNGEYDMNEISKLAADVGAAAVIEGKLVEIKAKKVGDEVGLFRSIRAQITSTVSVRVFSSNNKREVLNDVRTATVESQSTRVGKYSSEDRRLAQDPELIRESLQKAFLGTILPVTKAVDKLSWDGRIASVNGDRIYVNAGRLTGINIGDILKVSDGGNDIYDPDTGLLIGKAPGRLKGTLEVVSYFGKDGAVAIVHSGSGFKENDIVELY